MWTAVTLEAFFLRFPLHTLGEERDEEVYGAADGNGDAGTEGGRCGERTRNNDADPASGEARQLTCRNGDGFSARPRSPFIIRAQAHIAEKLWLKI
ncbi:hypothetical protein BDA96_10G293600 [Sorghum bicolor]|uniref:Secreted protein n=1 Tax=Sorghum bicolor TaxID=4558 RepID=A0A921Q791_SORBI|nr:hypothetical protein BDA96_10G293600 [Sorghum bicolor]